LLPAGSLRPAFNCIPQYEQRSTCLPLPNGVSRYALPLLRQMRLLTSGDLHSTEIGADHQTLGALPGLEQACATVLLEREGSVARNTLRRFRVKECHESIVAAFRLCCCLAKPCMYASVSE
jgi:hypothetical protein